MKIKIDHDVPVPPQVRSLKYPFAEMKPGDSFLLPEKSKRHSVASSAFRFGKLNKKKFCVKKTEAGFRCWRVK